LANATALGVSFDCLHFLSTAPDSRTTQSRNLTEAFNTPTPPLQRQQTDKAAPALLIQCQQNPIDRSVFFGDATPRMSTTDWTGALVIRSFLIGFHSLSPLTWPDGY
jgi:hypothetical protein